MEFSIKKDKILGAAGEMENIIDKISAVGQGVEEQISAMEGISSSNYFISKNAGEAYKSILDEAARLSTLKEAVQLICAKFDICENKIAGSSINASISLEAEEESDGTEKRSWWQRLWDWITQKDIDTSYTATTSEQEHACDERMREDINTLLGQDRFSESTWAAASVEERKEILEAFMAEVAGILGVEVASSITFTWDDDSDGMLNYGAYSHGSRSVRINEWILGHMSPDESYHLMTTIVHELRHAYQHNAVDHPERYQVSKETIDAWKHSFDTYAEEKAKGYEAYRNIVVERDARRFAGQD